MDSFVCLSTPGRVCLIGESVPRSFRFPDTPYMDPKTKKPLNYYAVAYGDITRKAPPEAWANKAKQAEAHKFKNPPDEDAIDKRIEMWTEKVKKMEVELRNKEENKEVSLGTSKANYMDPRITVAWCKRCDLEISRLFPKTLKDKFNWAMGVDGDWRFEAAEVKKN